MQVLRLIPLILAGGIASVVAAQTVVLSSEPAQANAIASGAIAVAGDLSVAEAQFVQDAAEEGRRQIQLANMMLRKGSDEKIREFAQKLANKRLATVKKLEEVGRANGLTMETTQGPMSFLPADISPDSRANREGNTEKALVDSTPTAVAAAKAADDQITHLEGAEFDKEFVKQVLESHQAAITRFEAAQHTVQNEKLAKVVSSTLPTLREDFEDAQKLSR